MWRSIVQRCNTCVRVLLCAQPLHCVVVARLFVTTHQCCSVGEGVMADAAAAVLVKSWYFKRVSLDWAYACVKGEGCKVGCSTSVLQQSHEAAHEAALARAQLWRSSFAATASCSVYDTLHQDVLVCSTAYS